MVSGLKQHSLLIDEGSGLLIEIGIAMECPGNVGEGRGSRRRRCGYRRGSTIIGGAVDSKSGTGTGSGSGTSRRKEADDAGVAVAERARARRRPNFTHASEAGRCDA
jgi:hypothetical protein